MKPITLGLALAALPLLVSAARADGAAPSLSHTAPFLGHDLTLTVDGAPPFASVRLYESPAAGQRVLPFGTLELDSASLAVVAQGSADANGVFSVTLALPADPTQAEAERHYQALVVDPAAPAGAVLSEARHLRILGPRAYVGYAGLDLGDPVLPGGLTIASAVGPSIVATVDFGAPAVAGQALGNGEPVFTPDFSRGAVMASPFELVLFDPFFGDVLATVPFLEASTTLCVAPGGDRLCVLETGIGAVHARVHVLDFETGSTTTVVDLPLPAAGLWGVDPSGMAYVAETDASTSTQWVRLIDLALLSDHGAVRVGTQRSDRFTDFSWAAGQLFVGTAAPWVWYGGQVELTRVDFRVSPPLVDVTLFPGEGRLSNITPAPAAGLLFFETRSSSGPWADFSRTRLGGPSPIQSIGPPAQTLGVLDLAVVDLEAWVLLTSLDNDHGDVLFHLDIATSTWTNLGGAPCGNNVGDSLDVVQDAFADWIVYSMDACGGPGYESPKLIFRDPVTAIETTFASGYTPESLLVVTVP